MNSFTTVIYTFKVSKHNNWTVHEYKCLFLTFAFLQIEREREWNTKFGYEGKCPQSYLSYFSTGFHWGIFLLSRATRLCSVFNTGLKNSGPSCLSILLSSTRSRMAMVRLPATDPAQKLIFLTIYFRWRVGEPHFHFGVPANHLASLSLPFRCPATWGY